MNVRRIVHRLRRSTFLRARKRAEWELRDTDRFYARRIEKAREEHDSKKVELLKDEHMAIRAESLADVMREKTDYWERRADRYEVPMPSWPVTASQINENWEKDEKGRWNLTTAGIYQVSTLIYEAQKRRRERWLALATLLAALTGILGTLIGVIAAWKR